MGKDAVRLYLDSYTPCPKCGGTMAVYKTRYERPERWKAVCRDCGKIRRWKSGEL